MADYFDGMGGDEDIPGLAGAFGGSGQVALPTEPVQSESSDPYTGQQVEARSTVGVIDTSQNAQYVGGAYVPGANYNPTLGTDGSSSTSWFGNTTSTAAGANASASISGLATDIETNVSGQSGGLWDSITSAFGNVLNSVSNAVGNTASAAINRAGTQATGAINSAAPKTTTTTTTTGTVDSKTILLLGALAVAVGFLIYSRGKSSE